LAPLVACLQSFAVDARQTQYRIRLTEDAALREKLEAQLKSAVSDEQKHAKSLGFDALRGAADKSPWLAAQRPWFPGSDSGAPLHWLSTAQSGEPTVSLRPDGGASLQLTFVPLLLIVFGLSFWSTGLKTWIALWPEQLAAATGIGFAVGGFGLIGIALIIIATLARVLTIPVAVRRLLRR